jgi:Ca-activated chloride channel homolog
MINWWHDIIFAWRDVLWGLLLIPLLLLFGLLRRDRKPSLFLSTAPFFLKNNPPMSVRWRPILWVLRLLALTLFIVLLARPQSRIGWTRIPREGIDIILALDASPSMSSKESEDAPSRWDLCVEEAAKFIEQQPDDQIGIVIFSKETYTLSPLTTDHASLIKLINTLDRADLDDATAIGVGLAKAVERLEKSKAKSKVIVLLTDGKNNERRIMPLEAAGMAQALGIRLYTIGFGSDQESLQIDQRNLDGSYTMKYGETELDETTLAQMAEMTGGKYFRAFDANALEDVYKDIAKLEKTSFDGNARTEQRREEFLPFLLILVGILATELILRYTVFDTTT